MDQTSVNLFISHSGYNTVVCKYKYCMTCEKETLVVKMFSHLRVLESCSAGAHHRPLSFMPLFPHFFSFIMFMSVFNWRCLSTHTRTSSEGLQPFPLSALRSFTSAVPLASVQTPLILPLPYFLPAPSKHTIGHQAVLWLPAASEPY